MAVSLLSEQDVRLRLWDFLMRGLPDPRANRCPCQPRPYNNQGYLQNGASGLPPGAAPLLPNQGRVIQTGPMRVLCIADVRGEQTSGTTGNA